MPDTLFFVDAAGEAHSLDDGITTTVQPGTTGRWMPPFDLLIDEMPGASVLRQVRAAPRDIEVPLIIEASDLTTLLRGWSGWLNPALGDGKLRSVDGGVEREIICRYAAGWELTEDHHASRTQKAVVIFRAVDPWWYSAAAEVSVFTVGSLATFFPLFPLRLSSSDVFATSPVNNPGDGRAWPIWTVTGPGDRLALRNLSSGRAIMLNRTISAGEVITIDTRPGRKTITDGVGSNLYGALSTDSELWPVERGTNDVRIELDNSTVGSSLTMSVHWRWLSM